MRCLGSIGGWWTLIAVMLVIGVNAFAVYVLGAGPAAHIAFSASSVVLFDGCVEKRDIGDLPVLDVEVAEEDLERLGRDLPFSGGEYVPANVRFNGLSSAARFRYRGAVITTHFLGDKRSFRLKLTKDGAFKDQRRLDVLNPKYMDLLREHFASWIAERMGVASPQAFHVFTRINAEDLGVMIALGNMQGGPVKADGKRMVIVKGDTPPLQGRSVPKGDPLWKSVSAWQFASAKDSLRTERLLRKVIDQIAASDFSLDSLGDAIDLDALARYSAALRMMGTWHVDNNHNQRWVLDRARKRLFPALWDPQPTFDNGTLPVHCAHDALTVLSMRNDRWRLQRDRYMFRSWQEVHASGAFEAYLENVAASLLPAVLNDRNKWSLVADDPVHVYRTSAWQWARAVDRFREGMSAMWERMRDEFDVHDLAVQRSDSSLHITCTSEAPIRILTTEDGTSLDVRGRGHFHMEGWPGTLLVHPVQEIADTAYSDPFSAFHRTRSVSVDVTLHASGALPANARFFNAVTDEEITPN